MTSVAAQSPMSGGTTGAVRLLLRAEGAVVLAAALVAYSGQYYSWATFAIFFLLPDLSFLAYLKGPRAGSIVYNVAHSYVGAIATLVAGFLLRSPVPTCAGLIWCAHIGLDRALGYGMKYASGFGFTHLGRIGRPPAPDSMPGPGQRSTQSVKRRTD